MKKAPNELKEDFYELFEKHDEIENSEEFKNKRRRLDYMNLESKHDLNTLSEIFQDPDLLAKISKEAHTIMTTKGDRPNRVRHEQDMITFKKPQAKDVVMNRKVDDSLEDLYENLEQMIDQESEFINPLAPKQRKYICMSSNSPSSKDHQLNDPVPPLPTLNHENNTPTIEESAGKPTEQPLETIHTAVPNPDSEDVQRMFDNISKLISESPLQTVGSKHLYTCLPRQSDTNAYIYVKEDYIWNPSKSEQRSWASALNDTLVTIEIFNPLDPNVKFQEIEILGSQTLSNLRDLIHCQTDFLENHNKKNCAADGEILNTSEKKTSPSFIYMDYVFYIDTRHSDFSEEFYQDLINDWMTKKKVNRQVFKYRTQDMLSSRLDLIQLPISQPVAFLHQEHCEHMMMVRDIRLISPNEYNSKEEFPRTIHNLRYDRYKCSMCSVYPATKITYEDILSGFSPCYFCDICFKSFHPGEVKVLVKEYSGTPGGGANKKLRRII